MRSRGPRAWRRHSGDELHRAGLVSGGCSASAETIACYHRRMKRAAVLGAGAWGTALAKVLSDKGERVVLWTRRPELGAQIAETRQNARYLPGIGLSPELGV